MPPTTSTRSSQNTSRDYDQRHSPSDMRVEHRLTVVEMDIVSLRAVDVDHDRRLSALESIRHWIGEWKPVLIAVAIMALGLTGNLSAEAIALTLKGLLE